MTTVPRALLFLLLAVLPAHGATFHVSQQGSDSTPCGAGPRRTINGGIACLSGGDTLLIGNGTYDEVVSTVGGPPHYRTVPVPSGSPGAYTTLKAATPRGARLRMDPQGHEMRYIMALEGGAHHLRIEGLVFDAERQQRGVRGCIGVSHGPFQLVNVECVGADNGLVGNGEIEVLGGHYHSMGYPGCWSSSDPPLPGYCHGSYLQTDGRAGNWVFDGVTFSGNSGYGVHAYITNIVVKNSVFRDGFVGGVIIVGTGGAVLNNCFERNPTPILCNGCRQEGNRIDPPGGCGGAVPGTPVEPPTPPQRPAPYNVRIGMVP